MILLVCGGRDYSDRSRLYAELNTLKDVVSLLVEGGATGADSLAREWAEDNAVPYTEFPAVWYRNGRLDRGAGLRRNAQMLREATPDLVLAFPGGAGTAHMVRIAKRAGVRVVEVQ